jgi:hypothetical protein
MTGAGKLAHDFWHEGDAALAGRYFTRDADQHSVELLAVMYAP